MYKCKINQYFKMYSDEELYENANSVFYTDENARVQKSNLYYSGRLGKWNIDFNADGLWNIAESLQKSREKAISGVGNNTERVVTTFDTKQNELYAAKVVLSYPLMHGNFLFGAEYSHNNRNSSYFNEEGIIANDQAQIKEGAVSTFVEYAGRLKNVEFQTGVRYEYVDFDYYDAGKYVDVQSKVYKNFFPSFNISFPINKVKMMFCYTNDIHRPSYHDLRSNITYANRYLYDKGNPFLRPTISHNASIGVSYKWVNGYIGYSHIIDAITQYTVAYSEENPSVGLLTFFNVPAYDKVDVSINISPVIGMWTPNLGLWIQKQWYNAETPYGIEMFNKPIFGVRLKNNFKLPKGYIVDINGDVITKGHSANTYLSKVRVEINASLYKNFLDGNLTLQLNAINILKSKQCGIQYCGIRVMEIETVPHRMITLTVRCKINNTKSKYKGTGAGSSQKSRI